MKKQNWVCGLCGEGPRLHAINIPQIWSNKKGKFVLQHSFRARIEG